MPRIRKKTSKRQTTHHRARIQSKVRESRKKHKKEARKNKESGKVPWKSKHKDPGIPNNFPYKDEILAEIAEQRRLAAEEKRLRKEENKSLKLLSSAIVGGEVEGEKGPVSATEEEWVGVAEDTVDGDAPYDFTRYF